MDKGKLERFWKQKEYAEYLHLDDRGNRDVDITIRELQKALYMACDIIRDKAQ
jgi:hypothetical protein